MTRAEAIAVLTTLKIAYPGFYKNYSKEEVNAAVALWVEMFKDDPAQVVAEAVKAHIVTDAKGFPPVIGQIKEKIASLTQPQQLTEQEAWNLVKKAMNTSDFKSSFNSLPSVIQKLVGSPSQLKEWAYTESNICVMASNFMRSYKAIASRERELNRLPETGKILIKQLERDLLLGGDVGG